MISINGKEVLFEEFASKYIEIRIHRSDIPKSLNYDTNGNIVPPEEVPSIEYTGDERIDEIHVKLFNVPSEVNLYPIDVDLMIVYRAENSIAVIDRVLEYIIQLLRDAYNESIDLFDFQYKIATDTFIDMDSVDILWV